MKLMDHDVISGDCTMYNSMYMCVYISGLCIYCAIKKVHIYIYIHTICYTFLFTMHNWLHLAAPIFMSVLLFYFSLFTLSNYVFDFISFYKYIYYIYIFILCILILHVELRQFCGSSLFVIVIQSVNYAFCVSLNTWNFLKLYSNISSNHFIMASFSFSYHLNLFKCLQSLFHYLTVYYLHMFD